MKRALLLLAALTLGCTTVAEYEVGVGKTRFTGNVPDQLWGQGLRSLLLKSLTIYPLREIQYPPGDESETLTALTSDQLPITIESAYRWRVERDSVRSLYLNMGPMSEVRTFVYNAYRNAVRDVVAEITAADILSRERRDLGNRIGTAMAERLAPRGVNLTVFFVREIMPPKSLRDAIEAKLAREQQVQAEQYQTQVVAEQANQRREEARGIRDAQQIIATSLDGVRGQRYLYWRYLEQLGEIGRGENNMVIAPTESGIPLFFGLR